MAKKAASKPAEPTAEPKKEKPLEPAQCVARALGCSLNRAKGIAERLEGDVVAAYKAGTLRGLIAAIKPIEEPESK